jgi:hypothetical protein
MTLAAEVLCSGATELIGRILARRSSWRTSYPGEVGRFSFDPGQGLPLSIDLDHFTYLGKLFTCWGK